MFDKNKFKGAVVARGKTVEGMADVMGVNAATLYRKINGASDFTRQEIQAVRFALSLTDDDVMDIFFAPELA